MIGKSKFVANPQFLSSFFPLYLFFYPSPPQPYLLLLATHLYPLILPHFLLVTLALLLLPPFSFLCPSLIPSSSSFLPSTFPDLLNPSFLQFFSPLLLYPQPPPCGLNLVVYWIYLRIFDRFDWEELLHTALGGEFIIYMRSVEISWWEHNDVNSFSSYLLRVPGRVGTFHRMHPSSWFIVKKKFFVFIYDPGANSIMGWLNLFALYGLVW